MTSSQKIYLKLALQMVSPKEVALLATHTIHVLKSLKSRMIVHWEVQTKNLFSIHEVFAWIPLFIV